MNGLFVFNSTTREVARFDATRAWDNGCHAMLSAFPSAERVSSGSTKTETPDGRGPFYKARVCIFLKKKTRFWVTKMRTFKLQWNAVRSDEETIRTEKDRTHALEGLQRVDVAVIRSNVQHSVDHRGR